MLVNNGTIEKIFVEPGFADSCVDDPFEVSDADTMISYLKGSPSLGIAKPNDFVG